MAVQVRRVTTYRCSLERAFGAPMRGDVRRVHMGFGLMPKVTHCTEDEDWARVGAQKKVFMAPTIGFRGGFASTDRVVERVEGEHWKIEVTDFQMSMLGFTRFVGEWDTRELAPGEVEIVYTYTMYGEPAWLAPLQWLFAKTFWWLYMGRVLERVRVIACDGQPFPHA